MDAREPLAKGDRCDGHLWDHICVAQWATAEDFAIKPASCCSARGGVDGLDWRDDSRAGLSRGQLRHAGPITRDDADHGISLSGAFFEWAADLVLKFSRTPQRLLLYLTLTSGILSALLVNDAI